MANKFRGESEITFMREVEPGKPEKEARFKLVFDANAFCEIEDSLGLTLGELSDVMTDPRKLSMKGVRAIFHGGLLRHHPDTTIEDAGDIMSDAGIEVVMAAMKEAFGGALKKPGEAKPPKARKGKRGTGTGR